MTINKILAITLVLVVIFAALWKALHNDAGIAFLNACIRVLRKILVVFAFGFVILVQLRADYRNVDLPLFIPIAIFGALLTVASIPEIDSGIRIWSMYIGFIAQMIAVIFATVLFDAKLPAFLRFGLTTRLTLDVLFWLLVIFIYFYYEPILEFLFGNKSGNKKSPDEIPLADSTEK